MAGDRGMDSNTVWAIAVVHHVAPAARDTLWIFPILFLSFLGLTDILLAHTTIAFVTRSPKLPLRSSLLAFLAWIQVGIGYAPFLVWQGRSFRPELETSLQAIYLSFVTLATLGYGDITPNKSEPVALALVTAELFIGLYFVTIIIAIIASWANRDFKKS
jgi:voltage-gated potassium channel